MTQDSFDSGRGWVILDSTLVLFYNQNEVKQQGKRTVAEGLFFLFILFFILVLPLPKKASAQETLIKLKVVADQANIRLEPDISSIIIRQVPKGTVLDATEKKEEWFAVRIRSKQGVIVSGYVHESLVIADEPPPEIKKPPVAPRIKQVESAEDRFKTSTRFILSLSAGGNYAHGGDLNTGIKGLADLFEDAYGIQGKGKIDPLHLGYVLCLEISFPMTQRLSWGIGAEHFQGKNTGRVDYSQGESHSTLQISPKFGATPIHLFLTISPVPEFYVKGGISYYFARCAYSYLSETESGTQQWKGRANAGGLGLVGGVGYIIRYSSNLSFFADMTGRLAKIGGFSGKEEFRDSSGDTVTEKGILYHIQAQILGDRTHSVLFIRETRPNEAGIISAEEAQIDLSGISFKVGFRIHF